MRLLCGDVAWWEALLICSGALLLGFLVTYSVLKVTGQWHGCPAPMTSAAALPTRRGGMNGWQIFAIVSVVALLLAAIALSVGRGW